MGKSRTLLVIISGLFSVALAVAVNVATGGELPGRSAAYGWLAWPAVGVLAVAGILLGLWQWRVEHVPPHGAVPSTFEFRHPAELPPAPELVGRAGELAAVAATIADHTRVVLLTAAPGTGKTTMALWLAHEAKALFPDGQLFATLRAASALPVPPETVLSRFLEAIGRPDDERRGTLDELAARFRSAIADRRLLIVLDDAAGSDQVRPLLPGGEHCLTLVTSRRPLADLPGAVTVTLAGLPPEEALALLAVAAGARRVAADPASAERIVAACAGLPLAVRLAGARLRARSQWTLADLADRLDDEGRRLDELSLGDRAVRSTFATAYQELSEVDQLVFRRAGSDPSLVFGLGAAAARCGLAEPIVSEVLNRLVDASLVDSPAPDRFRLHDLLRLFSAEIFEEREPATERAACLARQLEWFIRTADAGAWLAWERDNALAVLALAVASGAAELAWSLVVTMQPLLGGIADHGEALALWQAGEAAATMRGDMPGQIRALRLISHCHSLAGRAGEELAPAQRALALAEQMGDPAQTAITLRRVGEALRGQNRFVEAESALTRALGLFIEIGRVDAGIEMRLALGVLYGMWGRPESRLSMYEQAARLLTPPETSTHGWALSGLGNAYLKSGRVEEGRRMVDRAIDLARRLGDDYLLGYCVQEQAWSAYEAGDDVGAQRHFRGMLAIFERLRNGGAVGGALEGLAGVAERQGRAHDALAELDAAIALYERLGDRMRSGKARLHRSAILTKLGRDAEAVRERSQAELLLGDGDAPPRLLGGAVTPRW